MANALRLKGESAPEAELALQIRLDKLPPPYREYRFHDVRRFRFDFAWPALMLAVEVEGITHDHGRHQRKQGYENDLEKYELALIEGWTVYRCSPAMVKRGKALETLTLLLQRLGNENTGKT